MSHALLMASHTVVQVSFTHSKIALVKVSCSHFHEASHRAKDRGADGVPCCLYRWPYRVPIGLMRRTRPATSAAIAMTTSPIGLAAKAALNSHCAAVADACRYCPGHHGDL